MINNTLTRPVHPFVIAAREVITASELLRKAKSLKRCPNKAALVEALRVYYRRVAERKDKLVEGE